jgi:hypothetical protein
VVPETDDRLHVMAHQEGSTTIVTTLDHGEGPTVHPEVVHHPTFVAARPEETWEPMVQRVVTFVALHWEGKVRRQDTMTTNGVGRGTEVLVAIEAETDVNCLPIAKYLSNIVNSFELLCSDSFACSFSECFNESVAPRRLLVLGVTRGHIGTLRKARDFTF